MHQGKRKVIIEPNMQSYAFSHSKEQLPLGAREPGPEGDPTTGHALSEGQPPRACIGQAVMGAGDRTRHGMSWDQGQAGASDRGRRLGGWAQGFSMGKKAQLGDRARGKLQCTSRRWNLPHWCEAGPETGTPAA